MPQHSDHPYDHTNKVYIFARVATVSNKPRRCLEWVTLGKGEILLAYCHIVFGKWGLAGQIHGC